MASRNEGTPTVWAQSTWLSAQQVRAMPPEILMESLLMTIDGLEAKAKDLGIEDPKVTVQYIAEFIYVEEEC